MIFSSVVVDNMNRYGEGDCYAFWDMLRLVEKCNFKTPVLVHSIPHGRACIILHAPVVKWYCRSRLDVHVQTRKSWTKSACSSRRTRQICISLVGPFVNMVKPDHEWKVVQKIDSARWSETLNGTLEMILASMLLWHSYPRTTASPMERTCSVRNKLPPDQVGFCSFLCGHLSQDVYIFSMLSN